MDKQAFLSRHIILPDTLAPIYGIILIQGETIQDIIHLDPSLTDEQVHLKFSHWKITDFSEFYISPGIIDLNTRREWDSYESLTKSAVSGGVTFLLEEPSLYYQGNPFEDLYCDVGKVFVINDSNLDEVPSDAFALKGYIFQHFLNIQPLTNIKKSAQKSEELNLPLFIDPTLPDSRSLFLASPLRLEDQKENITDSFKMFPAAFADSKAEIIEDERDTGGSLNENVLKKIESEFELVKEKANIRISDSSSLELRDDSLNLSENPKPLKTCKKSSKTIFDSLDKEIAKNSSNIEDLCHAEKITYQVSGSTHFSIEPKEKTRKRPSTLTINSKIQIKTDYTFFLANCPETWENEGVDFVLEKIYPNTKLHFQGISSASAINKIRQKSEINKKLTCEIPAPHLFFNNSNIGSFDTRFKSSPPIRNSSNFNLLWDLLKMRGIFCISSQHVFIDPSHKNIESGNFQSALSGICSSGYNLQAVWSTLNIPVTRPETLEHYLVRLSKWFSLNPAKVIGIQNRGSISKGKLADLIIWSPYEKTFCSSTQHGGLSVYEKKELFGDIQQVYIRGKLAYNKGEFYKLGQRVSR